MRKKIIALIETGTELKRVSSQKDNKKLLEAISKEEIADANTITLEGKCMDFNDWSANDRFYNKENFLEEFYRIAKLAEQGKLFGSADHPEDDEEFIVKSGKIACIIEKLWFVEEENCCHIKLKLIPTILGGGQDLMTVVKNGGVLCVSLRAIGYMEEETKEAFVDTMYTFDVVAMPGFANTEQRVIDFETKKLVEGIKNLAMFESAPSFPANANENTIYNAGDEVLVNLGAGTEAKMVFVEAPYKNNGAMCAKAELTDNEIYDICFDEKNGQWILDEDDHLTELTEAIRSRKQNKNKSVNMNKSIKSIKKLKESLGSKRIKRLIESGEFPENVENNFKLAEADDEDVEMVQSAIDNDGDENFEVLGESENGDVFMKHLESEEIYLASEDEPDDVADEPDDVADEPTDALFETKGLSFKIKSLKKIKESKSIRVAKRLFESDGVEAVKDSFEPAGADGEDMEFMQESLENGDGEFEVLAEDENCAMIEDNDTGDVYLAESVAMKKFRSLKKLKESKSIRKTKRLFEEQGVEAVKDSFEPVTADKEDVEFMQESLESGDGEFEVLAEDDNCAMVQDTDSGNVYLAESRTRKKVVGIKKLKESKSVIRVKRLFEAEGAEGVEDMFEPVEADSEDMEFMQESLENGDGEFEVLAEDEDSMVVQDPETEEVYLAETEDAVENDTLETAPVMNFVESVKRKKRLKESLSGKKIKSFRRLKESEEDMMEVVENEGIEPAKDSFADESVPEEDLQVIQEAIDSGDASLDVLAEDEDSVIVKDPETEEVYLAEMECCDDTSEKMTESVKVVRKLRKLKEGVNVRKAKRLFETEGIDGIEDSLEDTNADAEDLEYVQEALEDETGDFNVLAENDEHTMVEDPDNGDVYLAETEEIEPEPAGDDLKGVMEKVNEVIETVNKLSDFAAEASQVLNESDNSTRLKTLQILKESNNKNLFAKKIQRILESAPEMAMFEDDEETLLAYDGLDEPEQEEIREAVGVLNKSELMEAIRSYKK